MKRIWDENPGNTGPLVIYQDEKKIYEAVRLVFTREDQIFLKSIAWSPIYIRVGQ